MDIGRVCRLLHAHEQLPAGLPFVGRGYPFLFFSYLRASVQRCGGSAFVPLDCRDGVTAEMEGALRTSFLGQRCVYWCGSLDEVPRRQRSDVLAFLASYTGPHTVLYYVSHATIGSTAQLGHEPVSVESSPAALDACFMCMRSLKRVSPDVVSLLKRDYISVLDLDTCCSVMQQCDGVRREHIRARVERIMSSSASLFDLSAAFFAKDVSVFMQKWRTHMERYPIEFWVAFWLEQVWQAYVWLSACEEGTASQVRQHVRRLPRVFFRRLYRTYTCSELARAHDMLYSFDTAYKQGCGRQGLDLFLLMFLANRFCSRV